MDCILRMEVAKKYFQNELFTYDFRAQFKEKIKCPVLLMYGDKNAATPVYDNEPKRAKNLIVTFCSKVTSKSFTC